MNNIKRVTATWQRQPVTIDLELSRLDDSGYCTIRGNFGVTRLRNGDEQDCRVLVVPINELQNIRGFSS